LLESPRGLLTKPQKIMKLFELEKSVRSNPKFTGIHWADLNNGLRIFGFKLNRKNSHVFYNFMVYGQDENAEVFFNHKYSQDTGKMDRSFGGAWNVLKQIEGYLNK
jgi:hypothetical protein